MLRRLLFSLLILQCSTLIYGQNNDCRDTIVICSDDQISFTPNGEGDVDDLNSSNNGCLTSNENSSAWFYFEMNSTTPTNSILGFTLTPDLSSGEDYDFAVYGPNVTCGNLGMPIRCSFADGNCNFCPQTGLGMGAMDTDDADDDGFARELTVNANEGYFLLIDNYNETGTGFSFEWTGGAAAFLNCLEDCEITLNSFDTTICQGNGYTLSLDYQSTAISEQFIWEGDPTQLAFLNDTSINNPTLTIPNDFFGDIVYTVSVNDVDGVCADTKEYRISVIEDVDLVTNDITICQGDGATPITVMVNNGGSGLTVEWENSDGNLSWLSDFSLTPSLNVPANFFGQTRFTVRAMTTNDVCMDEAEVLVQVNPTIDINSLDSIPIPCELMSDMTIGGNFNVDPSWMLTWTLNGTVVGNDASLMVNTAGDYILEITDGVCTRIDTAFVFGVEGIMDANLNIVEEICGPNDVANVEVIDIVGGTPPYTFVLDGGAATSDNPIVGVSQGQHSLQVLDANLCAYPLNFEVEQFLETTLDIGANLTLFRDSSASVDLVTNLMTDQIQNIQWFFNGISICDNCTNVTIPGDQNGTLNITLTNIEGCEFFDSLNVLIVDPPVGIFAPNVFSPNGDNINDFFTLYSDDEGGMIEELQIFNRWGNQVYSATNIDFNTPSQGWNGRQNGKQLNVGVYIFYAKVILANQDTKTLKGDFTLIK